MRFFFSRKAQERAAPRWGRVTLKPTLSFNVREWRTLSRYFRDRELAEWNGASPVQLPTWLFKRLMIREERGPDRQGFGILNEQGDLIGSVELYDLRPLPPAAPRSATLGIMIGERALWGRGYGREGVQAALLWAFSLRQPALTRVHLTTFSHNRRAQRAFAACGFREVRRSEKLNYTEVHMEVSAEEWLKEHRDRRNHPDS